MPLIFSLLAAIFFLGCDATSNPEKNWYKPNIDTSWQWQLQGKLNTTYNVELYDIDLFDTNASTIEALHKRGKKVICYFSAGSWENWRADKDLFPKEALGNDLNGWKGEKWLDITNEAIYPIMQARLDLASEKGCDAVEPDNVMGYAHDTGFNFNETDQLAYNIFIAEEAHKRGLGVGLKNDLEQITQLEPFFDFGINEECHRYDECEKLQPFLDANKAVFNAEYARIYIDNENGEREVLCARSKNLHLHTLVLPRALDDGFRYSCDEF